MDQTAVDPIDDLVESLGREIEHVRRTESLSLRDELQLRLYPLLGKIVETLVERIDLVYEELDEPATALPVELAGRIVALLGRYGDALRVACTDSEKLKALEDEAHTVTRELAALIGEGQPVPPPARESEATAPAPEAAHG